jgi:DNA repair protein RecO (recombination protein O)
MLSTTRGIVFNNVPYSDSRVIARIYTEEYGLLSFIITISRSKKGKNKNSFLQPLTQVDLMFDYRERNDLQSAREISCSSPYHHLHNDILKTSLALFISEVLYKSVKEEEANLELYAFISGSLHILDLKQDGVSNFHLCFLIQLTRFLGFFPHTNESGANSVFDLRDGVFRAQIPTHPLFVDPPEARLLEQLMYLTYESMNELVLNGELRRMLLRHILRYYELHLNGMRDVKSHQVLEVVLG